MPTRINSLTKALSRIDKEDKAVLFWTGKSDSENKTSLLFLDPVETIESWKLEDIAAGLGKIQAYLEKGYFAAGYLAYEAGFAFEEYLSKLKTPESLLMWFGIYRKPLVIPSIPSGEPTDPCGKGYRLQPLGYSVMPEEYKSAVRKIKSLIAQGDTYQVNYTIKKYFDFQGNPYALFEQLCRNQEVPYAAFIKNGYEYILSLSPELFFRCRGGLVTVRPMKGTIARAKISLQDYAQALSLRDSLKDRAENIMIVDLLRNDLGRVSQVGSVRTKSLFDVGKLNTLWQMTSTVTARLKNRISWQEFFKNIFPSGSVTGAPKIRTMEIIRNLEAKPRGIYTGSIGYLSGSGNAVFNVAIRTLRIDRKNHKAELGIGSGIVWDSDIEKEWQECQVKAAFLDTKVTSFKLIETMVLKDGCIDLFDYHLERLEESAAYFNFCFNRSKVMASIKRYIDILPKQYLYKLRLALSRDGFSSLSDERLEPIKKEKQKIIFSKFHTNSNDTFLYHKTTNRDLYTKEHNTCRKKGYFDCIFTNEFAQVTEGAISNIFIERNSKVYTPKLSCGLLNGVYRRYLLSTSLSPIQEAILYPKDIYAADKVYLTNAVSGIINVSLDKVAQSGRVQECYV
jgi:para-aminobenzoate synthetase/4-amino-4-deoxychorismate lyase